MPDPALFKYKSYFYRIYSGCVLLIKLTEGSGMFFLKHLYQGDKMKRYSLLLVVIILCVAGIAQASVFVLDFEDHNIMSYQGNGFYIIPNGYHGFNWTAAWAVNWAAAGLSGTGYQYGTIGNMSAFNNFTDYQYMRMKSTSGTFDFTGAYLTSAWDSVQYPIIQGWLNSELKYTSIVTIYNAANWYSFNFTGIDELVFISNGGGQVVIDNLTYNTSTVPIPAAVWLLGSGLIGLIGIRRFRK
jgi:hypothetical protein